jgi:hypothetical protein
MTTKEFLQTFKEFLGRYGWSADLSPWTIVEQWESLVDQVAEGYNWSLYEFTNDLTVRDFLEKAFRDGRLGQFSEIGAMCQRVEAADTRLKEMFLPDDKIGGAAMPWWHRGVLAAAGDEYVDELKRLQGIEIQG